MPRCKPIPKHYVAHYYFDEARLKGSIAAFISTDAFKEASCIAFEQCNETIAEVVIL